MDLQHFVLLLLTAVTFRSWAKKAQWGSDRCLQLGFNSAELVCSSCELLNEFGLNRLQENCKGCCQTIGDHVETLNNYNRRPEEFQGLSVKYVSGASPVVKLLDADGDVRQEVAVDKWNTETLEDFLRTHLNNNDIPLD